MKIKIINGVNLSSLGAREVDKYGNLTLEQFNQIISDWARKNKVEVEFFQSNIEGEIVNAISTSSDAIVINAGAYTHYSIAIADALAAKKIPTMEVHITNVFSRESMRHTSLLAPHCIGSICGCGVKGYIYALMQLANYTL